LNLSVKVPLLLFDSENIERRYWINGIVNKQKIVINNVLNTRINVEELQILENEISSRIFQMLSKFFSWWILWFERPWSLE
jgi:hypothetical protein